MIGCPRRPQEPEMTFIRRWSLMLAVEQSFNKSQCFAYAEHKER